MANERVRGRPPKKQLDTIKLITATNEQLGQAAEKRTNVYRILVRKTGLKDRTIRDAFAGMATDETRQKLETALGISAGALLVEQLDLDGLFAALTTYREHVSQRMRHLQMTQIRSLMPTMMSISSILEQIIVYAQTSELTPTRRLVVFETLHENLAYRHLAFDELSEERSIQEIVTKAIPAATKLRLCTKLSDAQLASLDNSIGELWTNSTLRRGDVWKRDSVSHSDAFRDAEQHFLAEGYFRSASANTSNASPYHVWRQYLSIEARARVFAKAGRAIEARRELRLAEDHLSSITLDDGMQGDLNLVTAMVEKASGLEFAAIDHLEKSLTNYIKSSGDDHHLVHASKIYLSRIDPNHHLVRHLDESMEFFQSSPFKTHWIVDVSKLTERNETK